MDVLECLRKRGQCLDSDIAADTGMPIATVRDRLEELARKGEVITCRVTRYARNEPVDSWQCRVAGYVPPRGAGRKPSSGA
ncbi:MAG: helix-turn-helix domain-containing protein [Burkholderiales bacterium]